MNFEYFQQSFGRYLRFLGNPLTKFALFHWLFDIQSLFRNILRYFAYFCSRLANFFFGTFWLNQNLPRNPLTKFASTLRSFHRNFRFFAILWQNLRFCRDLFTRFCIIAPNLKKMLFFRKSLTYFAFFLNSLTKFAFISRSNKTFAFFRNSSGKFSFI